MRRRLPLLTRILRLLESAEAKSVVSALRRGGQIIAPDVSIGPRVQIDVLGSGRLTIGGGVQILRDSWIIVEDGDHLRIGRKVFVSQHCTISGTVTIGGDTLIAGYVTILDASHVYDDPSRPIREQGGRKSPVIIGEDVWIGASAVVLPGVTIGSHAIIGANSTVTGDIPPWAIAVGSPARVIRMRLQP